jgi:class 3 adenylate cyclase
MIAMRDPGKIQVSESTYERLRDRYALEYRGVVEIKGKGPMRTYLLEGRTRARMDTDVASGEVGISVDPIGRG